MTNSLTASPPGGGWNLGTGPFTARIAHTYWRLQRTNILTVLPRRWGWNLGTAPFTLQITYTHCTLQMTNSLTASPPRGGVEFSLWAIYRPDWPAMETANAQQSHSFVFAKGDGF